MSQQYHSQMYEFPIPDKTYTKLVFELLKDKDTLSTGCQSKVNPAIPNILRITNRENYQAREPKAF